VTKNRLSRADTALLRMEDPTNLMVIPSVMMLEGSVDYDRLLAVVAERLLAFDRFRKRMVWPAMEPFAPYFQEDADLDLTYHVQRASLPPGGGKGALQDLVSLLASTPLDMRRPLWQLHLVDHVDGGSALIGRIHHCLGDGVALGHAFLSLTVSEPDQAWPVYEPQPPPLPEKRSLGRGLKRARARRKKAFKLARQGLGLLTRPSGISELGHIAAESAAALWRIATFDPDPKTAFHGKLGMAKRVAWSDPLPLSSIKAVRTHLGATVNDVIMAAMTGGMRAYLASRGEDVSDLSFRAVVPVNLREPGSERDLGNRMGAFFVALPVNAGHPVERLHRVNRRMIKRKESMEAPLFRVLISGLGFVPTALADKLVSTFSNRASVIMTNVIGPREQRYLAGAPMRTLMGWVPQTGRLGVGISILTYVDDIYVGVITDEGLVPDPERIIDAFEHEVQRLLALASIEGEESPAEVAPSA